MSKFTTAQLDRIQSLFASANSIPGSWIIDESIQTGKLEDGAVTNPKLAEGAVTPDKISGTITCQLVAIDPDTGTSRTYTVTNGVITAVSDD